MSGSTVVSWPCHACLRRSQLLGFLAPRVAAIFESRRRRKPALVALTEHELIERIAGDRREAAEGFLDSFDAPKTLETLERGGFRAVCAHRHGYPAPLRELHDPPPVLYLSGRARVLAEAAELRAVAIVGTRRPSAYGRELARELGRGLGASGVVVVSGLAFGIDAAAHEGCLAGEGTPLAVLAGGPDVVYPRAHRRLYDRVRERGVVVSEFPPGTAPYRWSFPARNRIMAGLAALTVVVEAGEPSGSLITAEFAADLGRGVAAVPGMVTSRKALGSNRLLHDGAIPIRGAQDALDLLFGAGEREVAPASAQAPAIDRQLRLVLDAVESGEGVDGVARTASIGAGEARAALGRLELLGLVRRDPLGAYERTTGA
jgi:DNA processing protein